MDAFANLFELQLNELIEKEPSSLEKSHHENTLWALWSKIRRHGHLNSMRGFRPHRVVGAGEKHLLLVTNWHISGFRRQVIILVDRKGSWYVHDGRTLGEIDPTQLTGYLENIAKERQGTYTEYNDLGNVMIGSVPLGLARAIHRQFRASVRTKREELEEETTELDDMSDLLVNVIYR